MLLLHHHDAPQYHLLVRNRLHGHFEMADSGHTVRDEGQNPIWRPGLVWIEEALAPWFGSVQASAAAASALGTTLLGLGLLALAGACFGRRTQLLVLGALLLPLYPSATLLCVAVCQGPEPWAAAALVAGLAALVESLRRRSWGLACLAGTAAGGAEWFRAGNYLVFAIPSSLFALRALLRGDRKSAGISALALLSFLGMVRWSEALVPSPVNKIVVALTHRMQEYEGVPRPADAPESPAMARFIRGYQLAPDHQEANYDAAVRQARGVSTLTFVRQHAGELLALYGDGLGEVVESRARGLRQITGDMVLVLCGVGLVLALRHPARERDFAALVLSAGALAHYFGPIVLLRGGETTHYVVVMLPLFFLIATRAAEQLAEAALAYGWRRQFILRDFGTGRLFRLVAVTLLVCLATSFYVGALNTLQKTYQDAEANRTALEGFNLEGRKVACRNMAWFADADVQTVMLPYGTADELGRYARSVGIDGFLIWYNNKKPTGFYYNFPYWSLPSRW
jgi:hypothetical protein